MPLRTPNWEQNYYRSLPFLLGAQERGESMSSWITGMRELGYGYNTESMRTDWRVHLGFQVLKTEYAHLSESDQVNYEITSLKEDMIHYNYLGMVQYDWWDPNLKEYRTSTWAISSDELGTVGDYVGAARDLFGERGRYADPSASNFRLVGVLRAPWMEA